MMQTSGSFNVLAQTTSLNSSKSTLIRRSPSWRKWSVSKRGGVSKEARKMLKKTKTKVSSLQRERSIRMRSEIKSNPQTTIYHCTLQGKIPSIWIHNRKPSHSLLFGRFPTARRKRANSMYWYQCRAQIKSSNTSMTWRARSRTIATSLKTKLEGALARIRAQFEESYSQTMITWWHLTVLTQSRSGKLISIPIKNLCS